MHNIRPKKNFKKSRKGFGNKKQSLTFATRFAREAFEDENEEKN